MAECGDESASGLLFFNLTHGTMCFQTRDVVLYIVYVL